MFLDYFINLIRGGTIMKISKLISTLILGMFLLTATGCNKNEINKTDPKGEEQKETEVVLTEPSSPQTEEEKIEITKSDNIQGWKTLRATVLLNRLDEDGTSSAPPSTDDTEKDKMLKYSIDFPESWTLNSSVFCDANNKKIAEITPAILFKPEQESIFLDYKPMTDFGEELISKEVTQFNSYKVTKVITKMPTESGSWYPHIYRISDGANGFSIFLYSEEINKEDQELFDKIVNTFIIRK